MSATGTAWRWWALLCGALVLLMFLQRACTPDPSPALEDTRWRDSLHVSQVRWEQDSAMREEAARAAVTAAQDSTRRALRLAETYRRKARWADSVARNGGTVTQGADTLYARPDEPVYERPDSEQAVPRGAYDSLWSAYETADSTVQVLHGAIREYILAAGKYAEQAMAAEGRLSQERVIYEGRITDLTTALRRQTRGCRVVGFIPCPVVGPSYSVNIGAGGKPHVGFGVSVVVPIKLGGK